jgi:hypothetical protein
MSDLLVEIRSNVDLVEEKRRVNTSQGQIIRQSSLWRCSPIPNLYERWTELRLPQPLMNAMKNAYVKWNRSSRNFPTKTSFDLPSFSLATDSRLSITSSDRKVCSKLEAFKEHSAALKRHIDNTSAYLKKEVRNGGGQDKGREGPHD